MKLMMRYQATVGGGLARKVYYIHLDIGEMGKRRGKMVCVYGASFLRFADQV